jgi:hypothetical protein
MEHRASVLLFSCFALLCVVIIYQQYPTNPNPNPNKEIASGIVNLPQTLRSNIERNLEEREPTRDIYHHKMYNYTSSKNSSTHKKAWMALAEVDGLKNEDVVMLITSTSVQNFKYIRERLTIHQFRSVVVLWTYHFISQDYFQCSDMDADARKHIRYCGRYSVLSF